MNLCAVCFLPITEVSDMQGVGRVVLEGQLYEGMYLVHRQLCHEKWRDQMAKFEATLPSAEEVRGLLQ